MAMMTVEADIMVGWQRLRSRFRVSEFVLFSLFFSLNFFTIFFFFYV